MYTNPTAESAGNSKNTRHDKRQDLWALWSDEPEAETPHPTETPAIVPNTSFEVTKPEGLAPRGDLKALTTKCESIAQIRARITTVHAEISEAQERRTIAALKSGQQLTNIDPDALPTYLDERRRAREEMNAENLRIAKLTAEKNALYLEQKHLQARGLRVRHEGNIFARRRALAHDLKIQKQATSDAFERLQRVSDRAKARIKGLFSEIDQAPTQNSAVQ